MDARRSEGVSSGFIKACQPRATLRDTGVGLPHCSWRGRVEVKDPLIDVSPWRGLKITFYIKRSPFLH
jgi:hypothetical protein